MNITSEERRNLSFAFIAGRLYGMDSFFQFDNEQVVLDVFEEFLKKLPDLIKEDDKV